MRLYEFEYGSDRFSRPNDFWRGSLSVEQFRSETASGDIEIRPLSHDREPDDRGFTSKGISELGLVGDVGNDVPNVSDKAHPSRAARSDQNIGRQLFRALRARRGGIVGYPDGPRILQDSR